MSTFLTRPRVRRLLVVFVMTCYALFLLDFITHPLAAGANSSVGAPYLFRWLSLVAGTFTMLIALFVTVRVPQNVVGPLLLIYGLGAVGWSGRVEYAVPGVAEWFAAVFTLYFFLLALPALLAMLLYFPTGQTYPRRLEKWLPWLFLLLDILGMLAILAAVEFSGVTNPLHVPGIEAVAGLWPQMIVFALLGALITIVLRYRHGDARERLQLRWVLWLGAMLIALSFLLELLPLIPLPDEQIVRIVSVYQVVLFILWQSFAALAFGLAISRHRLWDIDVIMRKTLVYGLLSAMLAGVYFGTVIVLQTLFGSLTGKQSPVVIVISTLVIAALFGSLRRRVQTTIDRRFFRQKYDAEKTLAAFAQFARDEVELAALTAEMVRIVEETVRPEQVGVWLRAKGGGR